MDWKKTIGAIAPTIARAIGGPIGNIAVGVLSSVLGVDANEDALEKKVAVLTGDDLAKIKGAEQQFVKDMRALDIDLERIDAADRASAREREVKVRDWVPAALAVFVNGSFAGVLYAMFSHSVPPENKDAFTILLGMLGAGVTACWGYYWGSSASSRAKDTTIGTMAKK